MKKERPANYEDIVHDARIKHEADCARSGINWERMGVIVKSDAYRETGLYDGFRRGLRKEADRKLEIALDPNTQPTRDERIRDKRNEKPYVHRPAALGLTVLALSPILVPAVGVLTVIEKIGKSNLPGSDFITKKIAASDAKDVVQGSLWKLEEGIAMSTLRPEFLAGIATFHPTEETANYIVNTEGLLDAMQAQDPQDAGSQEVAHNNQLEAFTTLAPKPMSLLDLRVRAAKVFMGSSMLRKGEIYQVNLDQRADFMPDGPNTFRIQTTNPYRHLYEEDQLFSGYTEVLTPEPRRTSPMDIFIESSRV